MFIWKIIFLKATDVTILTFRQLKQLGKYFYLQLPSGQAGKTKKKICQDLRIENMPSRTLSAKVGVNLS